MRDAATLWADGNYLRVALNALGLIVMLLGAWIAMGLMAVTGVAATIGAKFATE